MWGMPVRDWLNAGLTVSAGSNTPAAIYDVTIPFCGQHALCTNQTLAGVLMPDQQISRAEMLRIYTINGTYSLGLENTLGSLEPGKAADFVVIDRNILTCADSELASDEGPDDLRSCGLVYEQG